MGEVNSAGGLSSLQVRALLRKSVFIIGKQCSSICHGANQADSEHPFTSNHADVSWA
jgi:hypothetical protein